MKVKLISLVMLSLFGVLIGTPTSAYADPTSLASTTIQASGSLGGVTSLSVTLLDDTGATGLTFDSTGTVMAVTAPEEVQVDFNDNTAGYQSIIVTTDNTDTGASPKYTGTGTGAGLVASSETTAAAPLHWTVCKTQATANAYTFTTFTAADEIADPLNKEGFVDNRIQFFVVDRSQSTFNTSAVLGFATVIGGVTGQNASLANAPYDNTGTGQDSTKQREVTNGTAYMKFAVDYNGQPASNYSTSTLTLDLVTLA